jgi:signal transduction histidine kinase
MNIRRFAGPEGRGANSALPPPDQAVLSLYPELLRKLPVGVVLLFLEDPSNVKTFRIVDANHAATEITGSTSQTLLGRTLADFPKLLETPLPGQWLGALRSGEALNLGEISYGDDLIRKGVYSLRVFPLSTNFLGVAFEDVTERREKEEALTKAKELLELRVEQRTVTLTRVNQELRTEIAERQQAEEQLRTSLDQLRALTAGLQSVREEERTSISREIHDELGQACTAIKMDLALIGRRLTKSQTQLRSKVDSAIQLVDSTIATLRRIASELRPRTLDDLGLPAALESQAQEFESRTGIRCTVALQQELFTLDADTSTAIFRIFQESLTNVARHAQATRVEARLEQDDNRILFQVFDDGRGFDPEEAKTRKSLGLVGMQERALLLHGDFKIQGVPGGGTTMTLTIPLLRSVTRGKIPDAGSDR